MRATECRVYAVLSNGETVQAPTVDSLIAAVRRAVLACADNGMAVVPVSFDSALTRKRVFEAMTVRRATPKRPRRDGATVRPVTRTVVATVKGERGLARGGRIVSVPDRRAL